MGMPDDRWHLRADEMWERADGVTLTRADPDDYVWTATRPDPDPRGRLTVDIEAPSLFVAMDDVDQFWPVT